MAGFAFEIDNDIDLTQLNEALDKKREEILDVMLQEVEDACPVDTGYMKSTIAKDEDAIMVYADYASYTEYRTNWFSNAIGMAVSKL